MNEYEKEERKKNNISMTVKLILQHYVFFFSSNLFIYFQMHFSTCISYFSLRH